jgi:peptidoglycan/xylan/chitin deacetylase (PgdA/CDA1 family)
MRTALKVAAAGADQVRRPPPGLVVLIYHRVGRRSEIDVDLPREAFAGQMDFLAESGGLVSLDDGLARIAVGAHEGSRSPMVAVTFDDGTSDFVDEALPVLVERRVPATIYVATRHVDEEIAFPDGGTSVSWTGLRDAASTGLVDVGSHTHSHALLDRLAPEDVPDELDRSIDLIGAHVGVAPRHFAYPKALPGSDEADLAVRARFDSAAVAGTKVNRYGATDPFRLARSPIQVSDGDRWFRSKVAGGMAAEDSLRRLVNRHRYADATT